MPTEYLLRKEEGFEPFASYRDQYGDQVEIQLGSGSYEMEFKRFGQTKSEERIRELGTFLDTILIQGEDEEASKFRVEPFSTEADEDLYALSEMSPSAGGDLIKRLARYCQREQLPFEQACEYVERELRGE